MKFGGSSVASAERMWEVAHIMCSFPDLYPCIVLSAMGKVSINHASFAYVIQQLLYLWHHALASITRLTRHMVMVQ